MSEMYDVATVGAGPVGAVALNLCGVHGLTAVAFDREPDVYDLPRAAGLYDDVQRILHNAGVLDAILPATSEMEGAEFVDASGDRIIGFEMPPGTRTTNGYPPLLNIHQPGVERAIRSCLERYPDIELQASGGVSRIDDLKRLRDTGAAATIVGKALLEGAFSVGEALEALCEPG